MPCNLHQIWGGRGNKRAKVVQLINVTHSDELFNHTPSLRGSGGGLKSANGKEARPSWTVDSRFMPWAPCTE